MASGVIPRPCVWAAFRIDRSAWGSDETHGAEVVSDGGLLPSTSLSDADAPLHFHCDSFGACCFFFRKDPFEPRILGPEFFTVGSPTFPLKKSIERIFETKVRNIHENALQGWSSSLRGCSTRPVMLLATPKGGEFIFREGGRLQFHRRGQIAVVVHFGEVLL
jgi:hypothetical protein